MPEAATEKAAAAEGVWIFDKSGVGLIVWWPPDNDAGFGRLDHKVIAYAPTQFGHQDSRYGDFAILDDRGVSHDSCLQRPIPS